MFLRTSTQSTESQGVVSPQTTIEEGVEMAFQGANVLIWLMEMGWFEGMVRLYTSISSRIGATVAELDDVNLEAGFDSKEIRHGKLSEEFEQGFKTFLANIKRNSAW